MSIRNFSITSWCSSSTYQATSEIITIWSRNLKTKISCNIVRDETWWEKNSKYIYLIQQTNNYLHSRCLLEFSSKAIAIRKVFAWKGSVVVESTWNLFVLLSTSGKRLLKNILIRNWKWLWSITILHETQLSLHCHLMCVKYPSLQSLLPAHTLFPGLSLENTF